MPIVLEGIERETSCLFGFVVVCVGYNKITHIFPFNYSEPEDKPVPITLRGGMNAFKK